MSMARNNAAKRNAARSSSGLLGSKSLRLTAPYSGPGGAPQPTHAYRHTGQAPRNGGTSNDSSEIRLNKPKARSGASTSRRRRSACSGEEMGMIFAPARRARARRWSPSMSRRSASIAASTSPPRCLVNFCDDVTPYEIVLTATTTSQVRKGLMWNRLNSWLGSTGSMTAVSRQELGERQDLLWSNRSGQALSSATLRSSSNMLATLWWWRSRTVRE